MKNLRKAIVALTLALAPCVAYAQDPPQDPPAGGGRGGQQREPEIRPFDRVITKDAKSDDGVFIVHRIKDRVFYEIPKDKLGRDFLWVSQIAKTTLGAGYGGQAAGNRVVKWERRGDRILLRGVSYEVVADPSGADRQGGRSRQLQPDRDGLQRRSGARRQRRHRGHAPVHDRRARVQRTHPRRRARLRREPLLRRARRVVPREHRGRSDPHLQQPAGGSRRRWPRRPRARRSRRRTAASLRQPQRGDALQHGAAAREADAGAAVRRARRLLLDRATSTTARTSTARRSAASSRAGGSRRRTRPPRSPSR